MEIKKHQLKPVPRTVSAQNSEDEIYLSVKIGNGQIGGNKVSRENELLAKGNLSEPVFIGKAQDLSSDTIEIETNVLDVNPFTNECVITTTFHNQESEVLYSKINKGDAPDSGVASFNGKYVIQVAMMLIFLLCLYIKPLQAQNSSAVLQFENLQTPVSPGFILLDQTPAAIEKPTTPQGLGISLLGLQKNGGAMEVAPFWLTEHPDLTAEKMYQQNWPVISHTAISLASVKTDTASYLSVGLRTRIFQNYGSELKAKLDSIKTAIENALSESMVDLDLKKIEKLRREYVAISERPLFNIDFAFAVAAGSNTNSFKDLQFKRWAAWLSLNWRPAAEDFYLTSLARYVMDDSYQADGKADLIDAGMRFNYDISRFSVSLEYMQRLNMSSEIYDDYRVAVIGSYKVNDSIYVTSTFGKNFTDVNNIIALAGINFGYSKRNVSAF